MRITIDTSIVPDRLTVDELITGSAFLGLLADAITAEGQQIPEDIKRSRRTVKRELDNRLEADRERQLEVLTNKRKALATADEKRAAIDLEIAELNKKLGKGSTTASA